MCDLLILVGLANSTRKISKPLFFVHLTLVWMGNPSTAPGITLIERELTQSISDGHQASKPKKTVLALLDYSKAFGRVWREGLLIRVIDKGLPIAYAQLLRDFLSNR